MSWLEIFALIAQNAPTIITTIEEGTKWVLETWDKVKAAYEQDPASITKEQLLEQLDRIKANSERIQAIE